MQDGSGKAGLYTFAAFHVGVRADFEARAVGRQAAVQRRRYARAEVASDRRGAEQRDLRLLFLENPQTTAACGSVRYGRGIRSRQRAPCRRRIRPVLFQFRRGCVPAPALRVRTRACRPARGLWSVVPATRRPPCRPRFRNIQICCSSICVLSVYDSGYPKV